MEWLGAIVMGFGSLVLLVAAIQDADWLYSLPKSRMWVAMLGREGARRLFIGFGIVFLGLAVWFGVFSERSHGERGYSPDTADVGSP